MSLVGFAFVISLALLVLTALGVVFLVIYHRLRRLPYTLLNGIEHFSQLAGGFSLLLAVFALLYGAVSQETSAKESERMYRESLLLAKSQTELLRNSVAELSSVSAGLAINADASVRAAHSLEEQLHNQMEMEGRRPSIRLAVAVVDEAGGAGSLVESIDNDNVTSNHTLWASKNDKGFLLRVQIANFGRRTLEVGTVSIRTAALDGEADPTIELVGALGKELFSGDRDDVNDPLKTNLAPVAFSNLPSDTLKDLLFRIDTRSPDGTEQRRFRLYINFTGDSKPRSGIVNFVVRFGKALDEETALGKSALDHRRYDVAFSIFEKGAAIGNSEAMNNLARLYEDGHGVPQNCAMALKWYRSAIALGNQVAMSNLGQLYEHGVCVKRDYVKAQQLYESAATAAGAEGICHLGELYESGHVGVGEKPDYQRASELFSQAIALNDSRAMADLGGMYENGWADGNPEYDLARKWYERAAAKGNYGAMSDLGGLYQMGYGVPRNYELARQWYEKAAQAGDPNALARIKSLPQP